MRRGLVIGKFCPLHLGHQLLLDTASAEVDELHIWSWSAPEFPEYPPPLREHWLRTLYPAANIRVFTKESLASSGFRESIPPNSDPDEIHQRFVALLWTHFVGEPLDCVFSSEAYGEPLARTLSRLLIQPVPVVHRLVDLERRLAPISGTQLRQRWDHRLVPAIVARTARRRVVFLGAESTGKSTLTSWAAKTIGGTVVAEYGRTLWEQRSGQLGFDDMLKIAETQVQHEDEAPHPWQFCDTSPLTTLFYSHALFGRADPRLEKLSHRPYDLTFFCLADFPMLQDGTRQDEKFRQEQQQWYLQNLASRLIPHLILAGAISERQATIISHFNEVLLVGPAGAAPCHRTGAGAG